MRPVHSKSCKFDRTIIETRRSANGLETIYYCDPKGILKHGEITDDEKKKLLLSIDQNLDSRCKYYQPNWYLRCIDVITKRFKK